MALRKLGMFEKLKPGDRVQIDIEPRFFLGRNINALILASRIDGFEDRPGWYIERYVYTYDDDGEIKGVRLEVAVGYVDPMDNVQTAGPSVGLIVVAIIGLSLIVLSVSASLVVDDITDTIESPNGQLIAMAMPIIAIAAIVFALHLWVVKK